MTQIINQEQMAQEEPSALNCSSTTEQNNTSPENIKAEDLLIYNESESEEDTAQEEFADTADVAESATESAEDLENLVEGLSTTPTIPNFVYENLPTLLKNCCCELNSEREKDVFLTSALAVLSGAINSVEGAYADQDVYPNLYSFVIAPPASGKGVMVHAKTLGNAYHKKLLEESRLAKLEYETKLKKHEDNSISDQKELPKKPPYRTLFIPGNSSSSALISQLWNGDSRGVFCETEADTLANSLKQEWGNFSDLLRKAFHHEAVGQSRKSNDELLELEKPRLSVVLTGTPSQLRSLIPSAENGLFSRFLFYGFHEKPFWRSVAPVEGKVSLTTFFERASQEVLKMVEYLELNPTVIKLQKEHWNELDKQFGVWLNEVYEQVDEEATSSIKRLGLILYRIAMVLTSIRKYEARYTDSIQVCSELDFRIAMELVKVYKQHTITMFNRLPKSGKLKNPMISQLYLNLPDHFKRNQAVNLGEELEIKPRTVDYYLMQLVNDKKLKIVRHGGYKKV